MKRSIDIFSELLHNWSTQGTSSEGEWLKLLESQKSVHDSILYFLLENAQLCNRIIIMSDQCNGLRSNSLGSNHSNLHVYRELVQAFTISALVWAERGRARTLLAQLGPWYNQLKLRDGNRGRSLNEELIEFDNDEQVDHYWLVPYMHDLRSEVHCKQWTRNCRFQMILLCFLYSDRNSCAGSTSW